MKKAVKTKCHWLRFSEARDAIRNVEQPRQFLFTIEVVLKDKNISDLQLDDALYTIRELGGVEIVSVFELHTGDERRL